ncbi:MAG TPA: Gfo/Idh/MocA family oxidoreductase [Blastocatellia bacterium]|nr:Gfo/Idh/MocA family oxidoreductase [Blastocatellia bacterium]
MKKNDLSRRDFVKNSAAAIAATSAVGSISFVKASAVRGTQANSMVEVGWVGAGGQGTRDAQLLEQTGKAKIVAVADYFQDQLDKAKTRFKVEDKNAFKGIDGYKAVMSSNVDAVLLTTPPGFRPDHFKAAVAAKKHIFAEKPLAVDVPGCRVVMEAGERAKSQNLTVVVGLQRHYSKAYRACKKLIDEGAIGKAIMAHSAWDQGNIWNERRSRNPKEWPTQMDYEVRYWYFFKWLCGDHIVEQNIHNIDVINWMLNAHPIKASGFTALNDKERGFGDINDHYAITYEYANGVLSSNTCVQVDGVRGDVSETIRGTKATFTTSAGKGGTGGARIEPTGRNAKGPIYQYEGTDDKHYDQEAATFVASVLGTGEGEDKYRNDTKYGVESTFTAILGRDAASKGRILTWDEYWKSNEKLAFKGGA